MELLQGNIWNILRFPPLTGLIRFMSFSSCSGWQEQITNTKYKKTRVTSTAQSRRVWNTFSVITFVTLLCLCIFPLVFHIHSSQSDTNNFRRLLWWRMIWSCGKCDLKMTDAQDPRSSAGFCSAWLNTNYRSACFFIIRGTRGAMSPSDHAFNRGRAIFIDAAWSNWRLALRLCGLSMHSLFLFVQYWFICNCFFSTTH